MKLCIDCKFETGRVCRHPALLSPVDGSWDAVSCAVSRSTGVCGPEGKLFDARQRGIPRMPESGDIIFD